jgi:hypothetical protein
MSINQDNEIPIQLISGQTADTTEEVPRLYMQHGAPISDPGEAMRNPHAAEVNRLNSFLMSKFPRQMDRTNRPQQESPVDTAIRLLSGMATSGTGLARCAEQYCNLPQNHDGDHGYVNFDRR